EMGKVDDAAVFAHLEMLGIGYPPKMTIVPLVFTDGHAVAVFLEQMLIGRVAMSPLPPAQFHEVAPEFLLALVERRTAYAASLGKRFAGMNGRIVDFSRRLGAPLLDILFLQLKGVEAGEVDTIVIDGGASVRHPVGNQLCHSGSILDPDADGVPKSPR